MTRRLSRVCVLRPAEVECYVKGGTLFTLHNVYLNVGVPRRGQKREPSGKHMEWIDPGPEGKPFREAWERLLDTYTGRRLRATDGIYFARGPGVVPCSTPPHLKCNSFVNVAPSPGYKRGGCPFCNPLGLTEPELVPEDQEYLPGHALFLMTHHAKGVAWCAAEMLHEMEELKHAPALRLIWKNDDGTEEREDVMREPER